MIFYYWSGQVQTLTPTLIGMNGSKKKHLDIQAQVLRVQFQLLKIFLWNFFINQLLFHQRFTVILAVLPRNFISTILSHNFQTIIIKMDVLIISLPVTFHLITIL